VTEGKPTREAPAGDLIADARVCRELSSTTVNAAVAVEIAMRCNSLGVCNTTGGGDEKQERLQGEGSRESAWGGIFDLPLQATTRGHWSWNYRLRFHSVQRELPHEPDGKISEFPAGR